MIDLRVPIRSSVSCSPVLRGRLTAFRKDGSSIPIQVRTQMFYNDEGYVHLFPPSPPLSPLLLPRRCVDSSLGLTCAAQQQFVQCVTAVEEVEWPAPRPPPTLLSRSIYDQLDQPGPRVEDFASPPYAY